MNQPDMDPLEERALELAPARIVAMRAVGAARRLRVLAILIALTGTVANGLVTFGLGLGRYEWSRMISGVAWVWAVTAVLLALSFLVRGAAAMLTLDVVRAELDVAPSEVAPFARDSG